MSDSSRAVFISYASQDAEAARRMCDALRTSGVEVWFDADGGLEHGDEWDAKIRRQIKECVLFIPIISAATQARHEGYFRIEWDLAAERARGIASGVAFILPVVIDDTREPDALVPDRFRMVQWTRLPGGIVTPEVQARYLKLWSHRIGAVKANPSLGERLPSTPEGGGGAGRTKRRFPWLIGGIAVAAMGLALFGVVFSGSSREGLQLRATATRTAASAHAKLSSVPAVDALLAKINAIIDKEADCTREDWELAESMAAQAVKLEPGNASAWACYANAAAGLYEFYRDRGGRAPLSDAQVRAQKALSLAPEADEAKLALANCYRLRAPTREEAEQILREILRRVPGDRRALRCLGGILRTRTESDEFLVEAIALFDRANAQAGGDPVALREKAAALVDLGRYREAGEALNQSLELRSGPAAMARKINHLLVIEQDVPQACALVDKLPGSYLLREDVLEISARAWLWAGNVRKCLSVLNATTVDWVHDEPRSFLVGQALRIAGREEPARMAWQQAIKLVERESAANELNLSDARQGNEVRWKAMLSALLGDADGADKMLHLYRQLVGRNPRSDYHYAAVLASLHRTSEAIDTLAGAVDARTRTDFDGRNWALVRRAALPRDPIWEPLRGEPRFQALLEKMRDDPRFPPPAAGVDGFGGEAKKSAAPEKSVAVLAFKNVGGDPANEALVDGIGFELISALGRVPGLTVRGNSSLSYFKGSDESAREKGRKLDATYLIDGSVQRMGDKVRITASLTRAARDEIIWTSAPLGRDVKDVFAVQEEIAGLIAQNLSLKLGVSPAASRAAVQPEAFELYVRARQAWNLRSAEGYAQAEALLKKSVDLEPGFARAHAALSDVWLLHGADEEAGGGTFAWRDSPTLQRARAQAERAVSLDRNSAEALTSLGNAIYFAWKIEDSVAVTRRAIALNPNYASARQWLGDSLVKLGWMDEGLVELHKATELDPLSFIVWNNLGTALLAAGRPEAALAAFDRAQHVKPDALQPGRARALVRLGRTAEALALTEKRVDRWPDEQHWRIDVFAKAGGRAEAERLVAGAKPEQKFWGELALGRPEAALAALSTAAFNAGSPSLFDAMYDPMLDPIRGDPRFVQILTTLGLIEAHERAQAWRAAHPPETPAVKK